MKIVKKVSALSLSLLLVFCMSACKNDNTLSEPEYEYITSEYYEDVIVENDDKDDSDKNSNNNNQSDDKNDKTTSSTVSNPNRVQPSGSSATIDESKFKNKHLKLMFYFDTKDGSDIVKGYMNGLESWMKKYNCTYEVIKCDLNHKNLIASIAAKDSPDLYYQVESFPRIVSQGIVQPIEDYIPKNQKYLSEKSLNQGTWAGHIYSLFVTEGVSLTFLKYNPDLFLERGVKTPKEYYEANDWNWDTFRTVAKKMTGNGIYAIHNKNFAQFGGKDIIKVAKDGSITSTLNSKWTTEFLQWTHKLYAEDKVFAPDDNAKVAMRVVQLDAEPKYDAKGNPTSYLKEDGAFWEVVPFPKKPGDSSYVSHSLPFSFVVPVGAKNPAMSVSLALSMCAGWKNYVDKYASQYSSYEKKFRNDCKDATQILYYPDVQTTLPIYFINSIISSEVEFGKLITEPTATAMASLLPVHKQQCKTYNEKY